MSDILKNEKKRKEKDQERKNIKEKSLFSQINTKKKEKQL